jgi:hypothetical protein
MMVPADTPLALKPAPATLTLEMVTFSVPAFVSVTLCTLLLDTFTLPKLRLVALALRTSGPPFTAAGCVFTGAALLDDGWDVTPHPVNITTKARIDGPIRARILFLLCPLLLPISRSLGFESVGNACSKGWIQSVTGQCCALQKRPVLKGKLSVWAYP